MAENSEGLAPLFAKIAIISGKIGAVAADKKHGQGYMYHSADAILGALNGLMSEHGLVIIPTAPVARIENDFWVIAYKFILCDAETGATFEADWASAAPMKMGQNYDDKAMGKAHTYAHKYFLLKLFMISSVDTDDLDKNDNSQASKAPAKQASKPATPPAPKDPLDPETHFGTPEVQSTGEIKFVEVVKGNGKHPFIVADGCAFYSRQVFRDLNFEQELIDLLGIPKKELYLPDPIVIEFTEMAVKGKKQRTPIRVLRLKNNEVAVVNSAKA